ncbi:MAG: ABC transporter permease [Oscillospiraceae bacterium]|nr:ABC transporter permease [Oscillospiraceae bacterium]
MRYIIRKLVTLLITLFAVSLLAFLAFSVIPGDPAVLRLGVDATPEALDALRAEMGLDRPLALRYVEWLGQMLFGDMGRSFAHEPSVRELLGDRLVITGTLMGLGFLMSLVIALPIGLLCVENVGAGRGGLRPLQGVVTGLTQIMMAVPPLFLGLVLTFVFGLTVRLFTPSAFISFRESLSGYLFYMLFPALAIALPKSAMIIRVIRSSVRDELGKDYVQTAVSRGNGPRAVLYRHVLPNIAVPVMTFSVLTLIMMITDSIVVEQVFSIPGAGRLLVGAIGARDFPVVQALVVVIAAFVMISHALTDIISRLIDRRIIV